MVVVISMLWITIYVIAQGLLSPSFTGGLNKLVISSGQAYITNTTLSATLNNNFTGYVGFWGIVTNGDLTITDLGRWVYAGDDQSHNLVVYTNISGSASLVGSVSINLSGAPTNQFAYASVTISLKDGGTYFIGSSEINGASEDRWGGIDSAFLYRDVFILRGQSYSSDGISFNNTVNSGSCYGPPNFKYQ